MNSIKEEEISTSTMQNKSIKEQIEDITKGMYTKRYLNEEKEHRVGSKRKFQCDEENTANKVQKTEIKDESLDVDNLI